MDDTARWQAIETLLDAALDRPASEREAFVRGECAGDEALAARVLQLLAAEQQAGDFLESGPGSHSGAAQEAVASARFSGRIGAWEVGELLGRGGMGEVYRAERADGQYRQTAALKLIATDDAAQAGRFESERQILAQLNHPNIARLIDGGLSDDGRPYMVMEYVDGRSLGQYLQAEQPPLAERLRLFLRLCDAVSYAHAHLVVHRDIKPDNVQVDRHGEPRLLDFGIAKLTTPERQTEQTQALATPNYAAPEQFTGGQVTTATDVYGLGATLYFLLCESPPLQLDGASLPQLLDRLQHAEPRRPSEVAAASLRVTRDLDAICAKAMSKAAQQRYAGVEALADDLRRYLQHEPVRASAPGLGRRLRLYIQRNRLAVAATLLVSLSLITGLGVASWQAHVAALQRDQARRDAARLATMQSSILQLFKSASSDSAELTARELFARSAAQIERDFQDDPATAVPLMQMLGELLLATEDYAAAKDLLQRAEAGYTPELGESLLASISIDLAHIAYRDGDLDTARQNYRRAATIWAEAPERFRTERIWAATLASQLARADGETQRAVNILRQASADAHQQWGRAHHDTGIVLINLAVAHYYNNQLPEALAACAEAWEVWEAIGRTDSPDALNLLANWGVFAMRHGDPVTGERRLAEALDLRSDLYGPSAALATLMKNLGIAHRLNGRVNAGMRLLEQAAWMAEKYAGRGGRLHSSAVFALARALIEDGLEDEAITLLRESVADSDGKHTPWHDLNRVMLASLLPASEQAQSAALFDQGLGSLRQMGDSVLSQYADALRLRAGWLQAQGRSREAVMTLQAAIEAKIRARRPRHYEVLLLRADLADWLQKQGDTRRAERLRSQVQADAAEQFAAEHPIRQRLASLPASSSRL